MGMGRSGRESGYLFGRPLANVVNWVRPGYPPFPLWLVGTAELWQGRVIVRKLSFLKEVG